MSFETILLIFIGSLVGTFIGFQWKQNKEGLWQEGFMEGLKIMNGHKPDQARPLLTQCAQCHDIKMDTNIWSHLEPDKLVEYVTHGLCPVCAKEYRQTLKQKQEVKNGNNQQV